MRIVLTLLMLVALPCLAHERTHDECVEAADMVMHFAQARDAKSVDKATALQQYDDSVKAVSAYPPAQRWFVEDDEDVALLRGAISQVFDNPDQPPEALATLFKAICPTWKSGANDFLIRAASSERLIAGEKAFRCSHEANGAIKIISALREEEIPMEEWFVVYPIPESFSKEEVEIIHKIVSEAYAWEGTPTAFQKNAYRECFER